MTIEAGCVVTKLGCIWHLPPGRSSCLLPDSPDLWQILWDNRAILEGFAHSHPGKGAEACTPSDTDITTFDAIERALGKRLRWWICSADSMVEWVRAESPILTYAARSLWLPDPKWPHRVSPPAPIWVHVLREISGHSVWLFECVGCGAPCEFDSREPMLGWGCQGGSVCPGPWSENREFKTIAKSCVYCDPEDHYRLTGELPKEPLVPPKMFRLEPADHAKLDSFAATAGADRKTSGYRNDECPVWDSLNGWWTESDEQLRARIMEKLR